jgi:homocysteine S-methyltransferase
MMCAIPSCYFKGMAVLSSFFEQQGFVVLDGGLATELENRGISLTDPLWSAKILLSSPEIIADVHYSYFLAGADVAITSSYQATFPGLEAAGLSHTEAGQVFRRSVALAIEARDRFWSDSHNRIGRLRPLIAASIGPYGAFLHDGSEYRGDYGISCEDLKTFHRDRLAILTASEADLIACESIPSLSEAQALTDLLSESPNSQAWISFTCKDDTHISDGTPFADAVEAASHSTSVVAVGLNCTAPRFVNGLLEKARRVTDKPLIAYPNSGEIYDIATCSWQAMSEVPVIVNAAQGWRDRGAGLIGGCCRTTPNTIRGIRRALSSVVAGSESR